MHHSLTSFGKTYDARRDAAIESSCAKTKRVTAFERSLGDEGLRDLLETRKQAAFDQADLIAVAYAAVEDRTATEEQRELVIKTDAANQAMLRMRDQQSSMDRIYVEGFSYPGSQFSGLVAGKAHQAPFTLYGLPSEEEPLLKRVIASMGSPKRRDKETGEVPKNALRTGPRADKCWRQMNPLVAHDEVYGFFSVNCRDMWRHDCDAPIGENFLYASEEHALADLHGKHAAGELDLLPQFGVYTPDELFPGTVPSVHWVYVLPDDGIKEPGHGSSGVWEGQKLQSSMLEQVQATLNLQLGADPGGLANMYHGKHPCGPNNKIIWVNKTHLPTLGAMFEVLDCGRGRREMAGYQGRQRLADIGLDPEASNSFFTITSEEALYAARAVFKKDRKVFGKPEHRELAFDLAWERLQGHIEAAGKALPADAGEVLEHLLHSCIEWAMNDFNPARANRAYYNPGAAAHLIQPTDDERTRQQKGQTVGAATKRRNSRRLIADAMSEIEAEGGEVTISSVARHSGLARSTVRDNMSAAVVSSIAGKMLSAVRSVDEETPAAAPLATDWGVWGVEIAGSVQITLSSPSITVIDSVQHHDDLPKSWRPTDWDGFRERKLRDYAHGVRSGRIDTARPRQRTTGANLIDFLTSGSVRRYAPRKTDSEAA